MQMITKNSYKKLMCPTVIVTQITFDLEAFTYYAVNYLCSINNKKYGFFFDCGCEIVKVPFNFKSNCAYVLQKLFFLGRFLDLPAELCFDLHFNGELYGKRFSD